MARKRVKVKDELQKIENEAISAIEAAASSEALAELELKFLGKKGALTAVLKSLGKVEPEQRKEIGSLANSIKQSLKEKLDAKKEELLDSLAASGVQLDLTRPGIRGTRGSLHPVTQMRYELNQAFLSLGFEVYEGPEISSEAYEFDNMNFPEDHPARESMDTYWLAGCEDRQGEERLCLRPHLTGGSVRYMQEHKPPFRFVYPGRVYRSDSTDASHERAFYQYEALMVDKDVPFSAGKLMVNTILSHVFGRQVKTRMRAGFFPFVEPGFEIDMECLVCKGKGCSVCGRSGWVEMMPGGPPHPNVFRAGGIEPHDWQGFYINIGLDRLVMMKHGLDDVRILHSGDLRFLQQFS